MLRCWDFLLSTALAPLAAPSRCRIGITTNTRGGWEKDVFLSFREARLAGYRLGGSSPVSRPSRPRQMDGPIRASKQGLKADSTAPSGGWRLTSQSEDG
jgi:hypothetical protein